MNAFNDLSILSWNITGVVSSEGKRQTRVLIHRYNPMLIVLMETHCQFARVANFWQGLGYVKCAISEATGHAGGIWILKSINCNYVIDIVETYFQAVTVSLKSDDKMWFFTGVYASPRITNRDNLWGYLKNIRPHLSSPWLLMGDFNEIMFPLEVKGGEFLISAARKFVDTIDTCYLIDLGATESQYTWYRKEGGLHKIAKRLDRALGDSDWRRLFPEAYVENLARCYSDHRPLLLRRSGFVPNRQARPFRFQDAWLTHEDFDNIVKTAWDRNHADITTRLNKVRKEALVFNDEVFGNIFRRKKDLEFQICKIQKRLEVVDSVWLNLRERELQKQYREVLQQ